MAEILPCGFCFTLFTLSICSPLPQISPSRNDPAHIEFFREIGSVPDAIFYDRMAAAYDSRKQQFNDKFLEFSMHFGFQPCVCNPASPNEKGTDEESVGYVRRATFGEMSSFASINEATEWLKMRLVEINGHPVYRRSNVPVQGLDQERALMHPLPTLEFENYELKRATISRYSLVKFDGNFYSIPDTYRPRYITLKILMDRIEFLDCVVLKLFRVRPSFIVFKLFI